MLYLYRRGNGNEGNYARAVVELTADQSPYAALRAFVVNDYIPGRRVRRHIVRTIEVDGDVDFGLHAAVYEGPDGETDFGAAYLTAEFQPISADDADAIYYSLPRCTLRSLDRGARTVYRQHAKN